MMMTGFQWKSVVVLVLSLVASSVLFKETAALEGRLVPIQGEDNLTDKSPNGAVVEGTSTSWIDHRNRRLEEDNNEDNAEGQAELDKNEDNVIAEIMAAEKNEKENNGSDEGEQEDGDSDKDEESEEDSKKESEPEEKPEKAKVTSVASPRNAIPDKKQVQPPTVTEKEVQPQQIPDRKQVQPQPVTENDEEEQPEELDDNDKTDVKSEQNNVKPGAAKAASQGVKDMDKWKELRKKELQERANRRFRNDANKPPQDIMDLQNQLRGATDAMKAQTPGTPEFEKRKAEMMAIIKKLSERRSARRSPQVQQNVQTAASVAAVPGKLEKLPIKKDAGKPRMAEKIPLVKRMVVMSPEESLILDSTLSFIEEMRTTYFPNGKALPYKKRKALRDFLDLMIIGLPQEWHLQVLVRQMRDKLDVIVESKTQLNAMIKAYKLPRTTWSKSCATHSMSCGFWKLLHVLSIGVAEHRGGLNLVRAGMLPEDTTEIFSPWHAAQAMRDFIENFYHCQSCAEYFAEKFDGCDFRRCDRLSDDANTATDDDWKEVAKWLWEFHNMISVKVLHDRLAWEAKRKSYKATEKQASPVNEIQALWPTLAECVTCFNDDGSWNENAVFLYLEKTYWPGYDLKSTSRHLIFFDDEGPPRSRLTFILVLLTIGLAFFMWKNLRTKDLRQTFVMAKAVGQRAREAAGGAAKKRSV